jgi:hypothetical protein
LETVDDPDDQRVKLVRLSERGLLMIDGAVASMIRIDNDIARRIGRANLDSLLRLLALDWGPARLGEKSGTRKMPRFPMTASEGVSDA